MKPIYVSDQEIFLYWMELQIAREPAGSERRLFLLDQMELAQCAGGLEVGIEGRYIQVLHPLEEIDPSQEVVDSLRLARIVSTATQSALEDFPDSSDSVVSEEEFADEEIVEEQQFREVISRRLEQMEQESKKEFALLWKEVAVIKEDMQQAAQEFAACKARTDDRERRIEEVISSNLQIAESWERIGKFYAERGARLSAIEQIVADTQEIAARTDASLSRSEAMISSTKTSLDRTETHVEELGKTVSRLQESVEEIKEQTVRIETLKKENREILARTVAYLLNVVEITIEDDVRKELFFAKYDSSKKARTREEILLDEEACLKEGMGRKAWLVQLQQIQDEVGLPENPHPLITLWPLEDLKIVDVDAIQKEVDEMFRKRDLERKRSSFFLPHWQKLFWIFSFGISFHFLRKKPLGKILPFFSLIFLFRKCHGLYGRFSQKILLGIWKGAP